MFGDGKNKDGIDYDYLLSTDKKLVTDIKEMNEKLINVKEYEYRFNQVLKTDAFNL